MPIENPNIADRADNKTWKGPIGPGTVLTAPIFVQGDLPTSDPEVEGEVWNDDGVLTISDGPS